MCLCEHLTWIQPGPWNELKLPLLQGKTTSGSHQSFLTFVTAQVVALAIS